MHGTLIQIWVLNFKQFYIKTQKDKTSIDKVWSIYAFERDDASSGGTLSSGFIKGFFMKSSGMFLILMCMQAAWQFGDGAYSIRHEFPCICAGIDTIHPVTSDAVSEAENFPVSRVEVAVLAVGKFLARLGLVPWSALDLQINMCNTTPDLLVLNQSYIRKRRLSSLQFSQGHS